MYLAWLLVLFVLAYLHTQNNKTITYYASDNKSEDAKVIDY